MRNFSTNNSGSNNIDIVFVAGETIARNAALYVELYGGIQTAGRVYNCNSDIAAESSTSWFIGIALNNASIGDGVKVRTSGIVNTFNNLVTGKNYYLSTGGNITITVPANAFQVGIAISNSQLFLTDIPSQYSFEIMGGYALGGRDATDLTSIEKFNFSALTTSVISATINQTRRGCGSVSDYVNYKGYLCGGDSTTTSALTEKMNYSADTIVVQTSANLTAAKRYTCGLSNSIGGKGYMVGGEISPYTTAVDKIVFNTDTTVAQTSANLSQARAECFGMSNESGDKGYAAGGMTNAAVTTTDKITYSTDIGSVQTSANLSQARSYGGGVTHDDSGAGYACGGYSGTTVGNNTATADKTTYSNDTTAAATSANLSQARVQMTGISDKVNGNGFIFGGTNDGGPTRVVLTDKLVFSNGTTAAQASANLNAARRTHSGLSGNSG